MKENKVKRRNCKTEKKKSGDEIHYGNQQGEERKEKHRE